jgi:hypothetical protein
MTHERVSDLVEAFGGIFTDLGKLLGGLGVD